MSDFNEIIEFIRAQVNKGLKNIPIPDTPRYLYDPIRYSIRSKGKRFRPILTHLSGRANNVDPDVLMNISLAVELLHNFTLVHDDIMDNDTIRHGKDTIHEKWDSSTAILAGDGIYTLAQIVLNQLPYNVTPLSKYFNNTTLDICEGQALDKEFENDQSITEDMYLNMIDKKTGSLLSASVALPMIYNGESDDRIKIYEEFGRCLGRGFQIQDDILEITSDSIVMGKSLGSDIQEGKQTMMVIKARDRFPREWDEMLSDSNLSDLMKNIPSFFDSKGIIEETRLISKSYFNSGLDCLQKLDGIIVDELIQLVELIEKRTY